jgi:hypothetical protein
MSTDHLPQDTSLKHILTLALQLSDSDKARLIAKLATALGNSLHGTPANPRKSLCGLWRGLELTDQDIAQARHEMWDNFPREDI